MPKEESKADLTPFLNMVRTRVVAHPSEWPDSGYNEIQEPKRKCRVISYEKLAELAGFQNYQ